MSRMEIVNRIASERGFEDTYTILIAGYAEDTSISDRELLQMMFDILLGVEI